MSEEMELKLGPTPGDDVYLTLGRAIAGLCPAEFDEAKLEAELGEGGATMKLTCTPEGEGETEIFVDPIAHGRIQDLLALIRDKSVGEDQRRWRGCTIVLRKGGRFQMDVHY